MLGLLQILCLPKSYISWRYSPLNLQNLYLNDEESFEGTKPEVRTKELEGVRTKF